MDVPLWLRVAESAAAVATPALIAVGGFFAWYKFVRRGEHDPRLQPSVTGEAIVRADAIYIIATMTVQNTGQVDVALDPEPSSLEVSTTTPEQTDWQIRYVYGIFEGQRGIQAGETVEDRAWIEMPRRGEVAARLDLRIAAEETYAWHTMDIVPLLDNGHSSPDG